MKSVTLQNKFIIIIFFLSFSSLSLANAEISVNIKEYAEISRQAVTLGEIAQITGQDNEKIKILKALVLGEAPKPNNSYVLTREQMGYWLLATGADFKSVNFVIPNQVTIKTKAQLVLGKEIKQSIEKAIKNELSLADEIKVSYLGEVDDEVVIGGAKAVVSVRLPSNLRLNTTNIINLNILVNDVVCIKKNIRTEIRVFKNLLVAEKALSVGAVITNDDIKVMLCEITSLKNDFITEKEELVGKALRKNLNVGDVFLKNMLMVLPVVQRGQSVMIIAKLGDIEVSSRGIAMQDGVVGQFIRVENAETKKRITAKIIDAQTVMIEM